MKDNVLYFVNKDEKSIEDMIYEKNQKEINEYILRELRKNMEVIPGRISSWG